MPPRWATSKDVAERANVSRAAVSAVMTGTSGNIRVSAETRDRILQVAAELNYSPNRAAKNLRTRRSGTLAFAVPAFPDGFYERTIPRQLGHHLMRTAVSHGEQLIEMALPPNPSAGSSMFDVIRERQVDGVIVGWPDSPEQVEAIASLGVPVVQVMKPQPAPESVTITVDPRGGLSAAVDHLVALGHERVAYLGIRSDPPVEEARLRAFTDALAVHGREMSSDLVGLSEHYSLQEGFELTRSLLTQDHPPTAVVAGDGLVLGVLRALYREGLRVPEDFSVVGFDDELAASLYPPLSSVRQPIADVAEAAVAAVEAGSSESAIVLPTTFSRRESTAAPGRAS